MKIEAAARPAPLPIPPIEFARPELYAQDIWLKPCPKLRAKAPLRVNVLAEPERVAASFVHGYRKLIVELSRY